MTIDSIERTAREILADPLMQDKKDNLDVYRHIVLFLASDILSDVDQYRMYNRWYQWRIRNGILNQIRTWTIPQIAHYNEKLSYYLKHGWYDK